MSREFNVSQDPQLFYNGGIDDYEDDRADTRELADMHIFNPFLADPDARLDTFRDDLVDEVGTDVDPQVDTWDSSWEL